VNRQNAGTVPAFYSRVLFNGAATWKSLKEMPDVIWVQESKKTP
jgi:hypothetical protein